MSSCNSFQGYSTCLFVLPWSYMMIIMIYMAINDDHQIWPYTEKILQKIQQQQIDFVISPHCNKVLYTSPHLDTIQSIESQSKVFRFPVSPALPYFHDWFKFWKPSLKSLKGAEKLCSSLGPSEKGGYVRGSWSAGDPSMISCRPGAPDQTLMTADRYRRWPIFQFLSILTFPVTPRNPLLLADITC